jgi:hypothetical protein
MSIYAINTDYIGEQLSPEEYRGIKNQSWLKVILKGLSKLFNINFLGYKTGDSASNYNSGTTYTFQQRVKHTDKGIYELIVTSSLNNPPTDTSKWLKLNEFFIGTDERIKYNSQIVLFEYSLNNYFSTSGIYITNNFVESDNNFVMDTTSDGSSYFSYSNDTQIDYMDYTATYNTNTNDFTINVPTAFYNSLGTYKEQLIRSFADKYNLIGMKYNVTNY